MRRWDVACWQFLDQKNVGLLVDHQVNVKLRVLVFQPFIQFAKAAKNHWVNIVGFIELHQIFKLKRTKTAAYNQAMFDSPFAPCPLCGEMVLLDQTQRECAAEHRCGQRECPLANYFTGHDFTVPLTTHG